MGFAGPACPANVSKKKQITLPQGFTAVPVAGVGACRMTVVLAKLPEETLHESVNWSSLPGKPSAEPGRKGDTSPVAVQRTEAAVTG